MKKVVLSCFLCFLCFITACVPVSTSDSLLEEASADELTEAVVQMQAELTEMPIHYRKYAEKVGATLRQPAHSNIAVDRVVTIEGIVEAHEQLAFREAWIQIVAMAEGVYEHYQDYYVAIEEDGRFFLEADLFMGEGAYQVFVHLPTVNSSHASHYEAMQFTVYNVNPTLKRPLVYSPLAEAVNFTLTHPDSGFITAETSFSLEGTLSDAANAPASVLVELLKEDADWQWTVAVEEGRFALDVPLLFGQGEHKLNVFLPDPAEEVYQIATSLVIDHQSDTGEDIFYHPAFDTRGIQFEAPSKSGEGTELTYRLKGNIDPDAAFAEETTHLHVIARKNGEQLTAVIPVEDFQFDDSFYLRFGPGKYFITVGVPRIENEQAAAFSYDIVAQLIVENKAGKDQRDLLPSRGVQSDAPEIIEQTEALVQASMSDREKAKAIYAYTAKTVAYDVEKLHTVVNEWDDSALKTLDLKRGVCVDYAYLAIALLRAANLEARYVEGTVTLDGNSENHAWVEVKVDGKWLTMDPTWGAGYVANGQFVPAYSEDYFDPSEEAFQYHERKAVVY